MHFTSKEEKTQSVRIRENFKNIVLRNGVEDPKLSLANRTQRINQHYKGAKGRPIKILYLGRLDQKKNIELLLKSLSRLNRSYFLTIVGSGDEKYITKILAEAKSTLGQNNFKFCGALYDSARDDAFYSADIFILPSFSENFGLVIAEALIRGVPVICSTNTPWKEIVSKNAGWCIDNDENKLRDIIEKIDFSDLARKAQNGLTWMEESFLWSDVTDEFSLEVTKFVHKR